MGKFRQIEVENLGNKNRLGRFNRNENKLFDGLKNCPTFFLFL